ncbi:MAG: lytic murein transglycosylase [Acidimicrobiia bacterium]
MPAQADITSSDTDSVIAEPTAELGQLSSESLAEVMGNPRIIHRQVLAGLKADPKLLGSEGAALVTLRSDIEIAQSQLRWAADEQRVRRRTVADSRRLLALQTRDLTTAIEDRELKEHNLRAMSVDAFISGSDQPDLAALVQAQTDTAASMATQSLRTTQLAKAATDDLMGQRDDAVTVQDQSERAVAAAHRQLDREEQLLVDAARLETEAKVTLEVLEPQVAPTERRFEQWLLTQTLPGYEDLTIVAVNAYYNASQLAFQRWPGCRIAWNQLAGVGRVESFHGQFGRSRLGASGATSPKILGPQLNGDPWLAIPDTDQGALDDDVEWDRAVGPMQFIPTSWAIFAADGNQDGRKDPHNLYDAALAAADHLCGDGLDSVDRFRTALLGYNRSVQYGHDVIRFSDTYATAGDIMNPWNVDLEGVEDTSD